MTADAKAHYDRGLALYAERRYQAAAAELRRGFSIEARREFLFAEAQAWRLAGECARALPLYQQFLDDDPPPLQIDAARLGMQRCASDRAPKQTDQRLVIAAATPPAATTPPGDSPALWRRHPWASASLAAGTVAAGVGIGFIFASNSARDDALSPTTTGDYAAFDTLWKTAEQRRAIGVTALLAGVVLVAAGGTRLWWAGRREKTSAQAAIESARTPPAKPVGAAANFSFAVGGGTAAVTWQGAF